MHDGVIPDSKFPPKAVKIADDWEKLLPAPHEDTAEGAVQDAAVSRERSLAVVFQADPTVYDGSWANNAWLQELPKPITKLTWGNAAIMSPATAKRLGIEMGGYAHGGEHGGYYMPVVKLQAKGAKLRPAWIMPGHADSTITLYLGNGRDRAGKIGGDNEHAVGCNAYLLRTADKPWFITGVRVEKTGATELVACTQAHQSMEDRAPVRSATIAESQTRSKRAAADGEASAEENSEQSRSLTMYEPFDYSPPKHKWGMAIDLTACVGCHACVVACQAENNIAVVGMEQVACGREMHWLRIDRYADGPAENPAHFISSRCRACTAKTLPANTSAPSKPQSIAPTG